MIGVMMHAQYYTIINPLVARRQLLKSEAVVDVSKMYLEALRDRGTSRQRTNHVPQLRPFFASHK